MVEERIIRSMEEFQALKAEWGSKTEYEETITALCQEESEVYIEGFCEVCGRDTKFLVDMKWSNGKVVNFRERCVCGQCQLNNRIRYMVAYVLRYYSEGKKIYMCEQVTPAFRAVSKLVKEGDLVGSEYLGNNYSSGSMINNVMHQDVMNLSFDTESFDIYVSADVLEHVWDWRKAIKEAYRVLRKGGRMFLSIPFWDKNEYSIERAKWDGEKNVFLKEPVYHGDPLTKEGALVYTDFGWDVLEFIKECGFSDVYIKAYYSKKYGYLGTMPHFIEIIK